MLHKSFLFRTLSVFSVLIWALGAFAQGAPATPASAPVAAAVDGKDLFMANCASCHSASMKTRMTGPALAGVQDRWAGREALLIKWVRNNKEVLASGDSYANNLYNEYGKSNMTVFPNLTDPQINAILAYVEQKANAPVVTTVVPPPGGGVHMIRMSAPAEQHDVQTGGEPEDVTVEQR